MGERRNFYVYVYIDPRTDIPFYVGRGTGGRDRSHLCPSMRRKRTFFYCKLNKLLRDGATPIIQRLITGLTHGEAAYWESFLILSLGRRNDPHNEGVLCNLSNGGEGNQGYAASKEARRKMSEARKGKPAVWNRGRKRSAEAVAKTIAANTGRKRAAETREKIAAANRCRVISAETKAKLSAAHKGRTNSEEARQKQAAALRGRPATWKWRPVTIKGVTYPSVKAAAESLGIWRQQVRRLELAEAEQGAT